VHEVLLEPLRTEDDELAHVIADGLWRLSELVRDLRTRIDAAMAAPRDDRLVCTLVRPDDLGEHKGWVVANYRVLLQTCGASYD